MMIFNSPKNFKRGRYILNRYRPQDLFKVITITVISVAAIVGYLNFFMSENLVITLFVIAVFLLPIGIVYVLVTPMPVYFNVSDFIYGAIKYMTRQKRYKWEGIHLVDDEDKEEEAYEKENDEKEQTKKEDKKR